MVKVLKAGFFSTIQDLGRFGQRQYGVPVSGAMDSYSSHYANILLGNNKDAAVLEMAMQGAELQFQNSTTIAVSGAMMHPKINGQPIEMFKVIAIKSNDVLTFGRLEFGVRCYVAVKGGFLTEVVLGSRSMMKGVTGAFRITKGDVLSIRNVSNEISSRNAKIKFDGSILMKDLLEVYKGPEFEKLQKSQQNSLFSKAFQISKYNDRMAYQLLPLLENTLEPILTAPVLPGTIQLTPSGRLIILMRDAQTTGGYPRVLQLTEKSISILSQKSTGNSIKLRLSEF